MTFSLSFIECKKYSEQSEMYPIKHNNANHTSPIGKQLAKFGEFPHMVRHST